jgi:ribonucleoside-diphosphate reductase beta chain
MAEEQLRERALGGHFVLPRRSFWPSFFSRIVARLQWNPAAIDLTRDARAWPELPDERRRRLMTLFAGFCVAENAVSEHITPFADAAREATLASRESLMAWVFFLQRRDEDRHARLFDRIAAEVLGLPGDTPAERREAARPHVPPALLELLEVRLPAMSAELAAGRTGLAEGVSLYDMVLKGIIFDAAHHALREDLADDGALPGGREGVKRVELDERWHIGFGLRRRGEALDASPFGVGRGHDASTRRAQLVGLALELVVRGLERRAEADIVEGKADLAGECRQHLLGVVGALIVPLQSFRARRPSPSIPRWSSGGGCAAATRRAVGAIRRVGAAAQSGRRRRGERRRVSRAGRE